MASTAVVTVGAGVAQEASAPVIEEEFVIRGQFVPDEKRATSEVSNVLDEEALSLTGDSNIAESLKRVTGLSLVGGKFVFVRGLGERYSQTLLNGAQLPSPEPLRRVVPLDIFPNTLLSGVLVQKTYSPEFPLDFGGGVVNLRSSRIPDARFFEVGFSGSIDTATHTEDIVTHNGESTDWTTADWGAREFPEILRGFERGQESAQGEELRELAGESLRLSGYDVNVDSTPFANHGFEVSYGDNYYLGGHRFGLLFATDYGGSWNNNVGIRRDFVVNESPDGEIELDSNNDFSPAAGSCVEEGVEDCGLFNTTRSISLNGIVAVGWEPSADHAFQITSIVLRSTDKETLLQRGESGADPGTPRELVRNDWVERQAWANQAMGDHQFDVLADLWPGFSLTNFKWRAVYSKADRDVEDRKQYSRELTSAGNFRLETRPNEFFLTNGTLEDETVEFFGDIIQPLSVFGRAVDIKIGGGYNRTLRDSEVLRFGYDFVLQDLVPGDPRASIFARNDLLEQNVGSIITAENIRPGGLEVINLTDASDTFGARLRTLSGYFQLDAELAPTVRMAAGFRWEGSEQAATTITRSTLRCPELIGSARILPECAENPLADIPGGTEVVFPLEERFLLPAGTLTWEFLPNYQFRIGASQTINRPSLRELSFAQFIDPDRDVLVQGDPSLAIARVNNYDARLEWYFGKAQYLSIAGFYKDFTDPIEQIRRREGNTLFRSFQNAETANLFGAEIEWELRLPFLDRPLAKVFPYAKSWELFFNGNVSVIRSDVTLRFDPRNPVTNENRDLQGQSGVLANSQFGYEDVERGERMLVLFNYTGDRIQDVGVQGAPDFIDQAQYLVDFVYKKEFYVGSGVYELGFEARNLLGEEFQLTVGDLDAELWEIGRSFEVSFKIRY